MPPEPVDDSFFAYLKSEAEKIGTVAKDGVVELPNTVK